jgi:hypothetical protein
MKSYSQTTSTQLQQREGVTDSSSNFSAFAKETDPIRGKGGALANKMFHCGSIEHKSLAIMKQYLSENGVLY